MKRNYITENVFFMSQCLENLGDKSIKCRADVMQIRG